MLKECEHSVKSSAYPDTRLGQSAIALPVRLPAGQAWHLAVEKRGCSQGSQFAEELGTRGNQTSSQTETTATVAAWEPLYAFCPNLPLFQTLQSLYPPPGI